MNAARQSAYPAMPQCSGGSDDCPAPGAVPSNHREVAGQFVDLSAPCRRPVTDEAMQQNEWRPRAGALVRDVETLNFDVIHWSHR